MDNNVKERLKDIILRASRALSSGDLSDVQNLLEIDEEIKMEQYSANGALPNGNSNGNASDSTPSGQPPAGCCGGSNTGSSCCKPQGEKDEKDN